MDRTTRANSYHRLSSCDVPHASSPSSVLISIIKPIFQIRKAMFPKTKCHAQSHRALQCRPSQNPGLDPGVSAFSFAWLAPSAVVRAPAPPRMLRTPQSPWRWWAPVLAKAAYLPSAALSGSSFFEKQLRQGRCKGHEAWYLFTQSFCRALSTAEWKVRALQASRNPSLPRMRGLHESEEGIGPIHLRDCEC